MHKEQGMTKEQWTINPKNSPKEILKKRLLTVQETSIYLGRSVPSIRELIWKGELPFVRVGRRVHLDVFDLDRWIDQHKIKYTF